MNPLISVVFACLLRAIVSTPDPERLVLPDEADGNLELPESWTPNQCRRELRAHLRRVRRHYDALESYKRGTGTPEKSLCWKCLP